MKIFTLFGLSVMASYNLLANAENEQSVNHHPTVRIHNYTVATTIPPDFQLEDKQPDDIGSAEIWSSKEKDNFVDISITLSVPTTKKHIILGDEGLEMVKAIDENGSSYDVGFSSGLYFSSRGRGSSQELSTGLGIKDIHAFGNVRIVGSIPVELFDYQNALEELPVKDCSNRTVSIYDVECQVSIDIQDEMAVLRLIFPQDCSDYIKYGVKHIDDKFYSSAWGYKVRDDGSYITEHRFPKKIIDKLFLYFQVKTNEERINIPIDEVINCGLQNVE